MQHRDEKAALLTQKRGNVYAAMPMYRGITFLIVRFMEAGTCPLSVGPNPRKDRQAAKTAKAGTPGNLHSDTVLPSDGR